MELKEEEQEAGIPQDETMSIEDEVDQKADQPEEQEGEEEEEELTDEAMLRAHEIVNSNLYGAVAREGSVDDEFETEQRPMMASQVQARLLNQFLRNELQEIDADLRREEKQKKYLRNHFRFQKKMKTKVNQEGQEERTKADIFTNTSSSEFLSFLQPESDDRTRQSQDEFEKESITKTMGAFKNKMPAALDKPLQPEPRVQVNVPKPEPEGREHSHEEVISALDGLAVLDKQYKHKGYGFYGKYFRDTHSSSLNFGKYRKNDNIQHPQAGIDNERERFG